MNTASHAGHDLPALIPITVADLRELFREVIRDEIAASREVQNHDKLVSGPEAVNYFSPAISRQTLANWVKEGLIPVQKINGKNYYRHTDLLQAGTRLKLYKRPGELIETQKR